MRIREIIISKIVLPFRVEFSHSLRKRISVKNIVVVFVGENGKILGCGEGAPRPYVTGETTETAERYIRDLISREDFPREIENIEQIWAYIDGLPGNKEMNASICAIEMALLDGFSRKNNKQVIDYFPHDYYSGSIEYGAAIPLSTSGIAETVSRKIKELGINKLKLKMGRDYLQNLALLEIIDNVFTEGYDLKLDVNGVWTYETGVQHLELLSRYNMKLLEQPMSPQDQEIYKFYQEAEKYDIELMADESACSIDDLDKLSRNRCYQMINIRVSKCGGLRRSMQMIEYLRNKKIKFQIGCQLGESGLLSSAGRILSLLSSDSVYYDGSYDNLLLAENITDRDVSFGYGGKAYPLNGPGLGVDVDINKVNKLSEHSLIMKL